VSEETFDARMERLLRTLPPALRGMGFGDPDDVEYAHASDVVAWAIREIDKLREERRWVPVGERLPEHGDSVWVFDGTDVVIGEYWGTWQSYGASCDREGLNSETLLGITHWTEIWMPLPPGPEGKDMG